MAPPTSTLRDPDSPDTCLEAAQEIVTDELARLEATLSSCDGAAATRLVSRFDAIARAATAGWALAARRAAALEVHSATGDRNATDWLAQQSGISFARAKEALTLADRLEPSPPVKEAFARGELTLTEAALIADAVDVAPEAGADMVRVARDGSHFELCQESRRILQTARSRDDERARRARAYNRRSLRFSQLPDGGVRVQAYLTDAAWGRCLARLDARADVLFRIGRSAKVHATRDQYRADALVDLVAGRHGHKGDAQVEGFMGDAAGGDGRAAGGYGGAAGGYGGGLSAASVTTIVRVDAASLRRGSVGPGETCEIAGVGPVSVDTATELLGEWYVRLLVTDGADVTTITGRHRHVPARVETALYERDRTCVVPRCDVTFGLETHHWQTEVRAGGPTNLANLCRLCSVHHDLASNAGWTIRGGPGQWEWTGPDWPVSTQLQQTRRRIAAARGRSPGD